MEELYKARFRLSDNLLLTAVFLIPFLRCSLFYRPFAEIKWIALYAIAFVVLLFAVIKSVVGKRMIEIPKVSPVFWWGAFLILLNQVIVQIAHSQPLMNDYWVDRVSFLVFFILAFNLQSRDAQFYKRLVRAAVFSVTAFTIGFLFTLLFRSPTTNELALSLGNINMAAQFLSFSLPFVFIELMEARKERSSLVQNLLSALLVLIYTAVFFTACRSCWIGSLGVLAYFALARRIFSFKRIAVMVASVVMLILSIHAFSLVKPSSATEFFSAKVQNYSRATGMSGRGDAWKQTLRMISDHPFGIGPDRFQMSFLEYQIANHMKTEEGIFWPSPHDEALRILSEEGWAGLLFFAMAAGALLWFLFQSSESYGIARTLLIATLIVWVPELIFQFPLAMANSMVILALVLGSVCGLCASTSRIQISRALPLCALLMVAMIGGSHAVFRTLERKYPNDRRWTDLACRMSPSYWQACVNAIGLNMMYGYSDRAHQIVDQILDNYPNHYPTLKAAGNIAFFENDKRSGCGYLTRYDAIFDSRSSLHPQLEKLCPIK
jgi:O-antigen ligase